LPWREAASASKLKVREQVVDPTLHLLGFSLQWKGGSAVISKVISGSAAEDGEFSPHDEILAINETRVTDAEKFQLALDSAVKEGKEIEVLVCRLDKVFPRYLRWKKHAGLGVEYVV
jgi:S1-C subfamily serine protease